MEFSRKKREGSKEEIEVKISSKEVEQNREKALSFFQKEVSVEGFRQGHVPKDMVKERVSKEQVFAKAVELSIQEAYGSLLKEQDLQVLGEPEIRIVQAKEGEPLVFHIHVSLFPSITLPDYKEIASGVVKKEVQVRQEDVDKTLEWLQKSRKKEDGTLPELNDEFAQSLGKFSNAKSLKKSVEEGVFMEKELKEKNRVRQEIVASIAAKAELEVPEVLVQQEQQSLLEQTKQGVKQTLQIEFSEYLKNMQKTEEELKASFTTQAENRIRQFLVLDAIAKKEEIAPSTEEIQEQARKLASQYPEANTAERQLDPKELRLYSEGVLRNEKTLRFLESFVK